MKLNEFQALLTPKVLLVPYSERHVPTYHEWMKDEELQKATASEPLALLDEHAMQKSWRDDADKLTFIACTPAPDSGSAIQYSGPRPETEIPTVQPGKDDSPEVMLGDVNLFLVAADDDEDEEEDADFHTIDEATKQLILEGKLQAVVGEVEIMIARKELQGKGMGREILLTFLWYIISSLSEIMNEYHKSHNGGKAGSYMKYLRVKIDKENARSIRLFENAGFTKVHEQPNYFGELELRLPLSARSSDVMLLGTGVIPRLADYKATS
ncbi:GNAT domain-containing protein [Massariosphaeria phaeospora]|uniref:GNAT domain-containing protein n=1 Tax=Massariosphaeria phaeospora TaxID=100035 RepID=A0A7C8MFC7_9PLEO|nr:GNAT domain-containing protein [Massariosphaeria phaeospora]